MHKPPFTRSRLRAKTGESDLAVPLGVRHARAEHETQRILVSFSFRIAFALRFLGVDHRTRRESHTPFGARRPKPQSPSEALASPQQHLCFTFVVPACYACALALSPTLPSFRDAALRQRTRNAGVTFPSPATKIRFSSCFVCPKSCPQTLTISPSHPPSRVFLPSSSFVSLPPQRDESAGRNSCTIGGLNETRGE